MSAFARFLPQPRGLAARTGSPTGLSGPSRRHTPVTYGRAPKAGRKARLKRARDRLAEAALETPGTVSVGAIAREEGFSPSGFSRAFRKETGKTARQTIMETRVAQAARLIEGGAAPAEAAAASGFADQAHMTRAFRKVRGDTPGALSQGPDRKPASRTPTKGKNVQD